MRSKKTATFRKSETCPSAEALLMFHHVEKLNRETRAILSHLEKCDFCSAESYFLSKYPQKPEDVEEQCNDFVEMPPAVRQLAEALLGGKRKEFRLLSELFKHREIKTAKKA